MPFLLALGSNIGDRLAHFRQGIAKLIQRDPSAHVISTAPIYETAPVDCPPDSQSFYNTVIELESDLDPHALYLVLRSIEQQLGRPDERQRNAPRPLDLDILTAGNAIIHDDLLTLPHPRLHQRRFVLAPLAELHPRLIVPGQTRTISEMLAALPDEPSSVRLVRREWL